ncbi:MAG: DUF6998 domain-containing protein [Candidatus Heteroscillospira sp.]
MIGGAIHWATSTEKHDATGTNGRFVQIAATQIKRIAISSEPDHLIVIKISDSGGWEELYTPKPSERPHFSFVNILEKAATTRPTTHSQMRLNLIYLCCKWDSSPIKLSTIDTVALGRKECD